MLSKILVLILYRHWQKFGKFWGLSNFERWTFEGTGLTKFKYEWHKLNSLCQVPQWLVDEVRSSRHRGWCTVIQPVADELPTHVPHDQGILRTARPAAGWHALACKVYTPSRAGCSRLNTPMRVHARLSRVAADVVDHDGTGLYQALQTPQGGGPAPPAKL